MTSITFYKYQGAGNDFIMFDHRGDYPKALEQPSVVHKLCDRRFGIGADGLIRLTNVDNADFEMHYYNADGHLGSMCGNGGRCAVAFAKQLGIIDSSCRFMAVDGAHDAIINRPNWVELHMQDVNAFQRQEGAYFLDTGSPHHVAFVDQLEVYQVFENGRRIRYGEPYGEKGTNVNFVEKEGDTLRIRTYERGVEDETLACGTGVTAAALALSIEENRVNQQAIQVKAKGGDLEVRFNRKTPNHFSDIWLCGPATFVFQGQFQLEAFLPKT